MIRLHYRIADALDECLQRLETGKVNPKPTRMSCSENRKKIVFDGMDDFMPSVITAALNERVDPSSDSTSMSEDSESE